MAGAVYFQCDITVSIKSCKKPQGCEDRWERESPPKTWLTCFNPVTEVSYVPWGIRMEELPGEGSARTRLFTFIKSGVFVILTFILSASLVCDE